MRPLRLLLLAFLIAVLLSRQAARFLVVDHPQQSDAIVALAGDTGVRPARALELLRQGMAPRVLLDVEANQYLFDERLTAIAERYVKSLPEGDRVSVCAIGGLSTDAETADVARCLQPAISHRVLIVTSDFHTRRALSIFSHRLPQYQWSVAAARNPDAFGEAWWTRREWAKTTFDEWTKLIWWELIDRWK
jgi:hypothetical protein